ncbi:toll/interleukin-1 receptor domain-containing protein [Streptomyces capillispiralis]|uniref:TIR domain-containing protein n=1 Tax=Streptomyces capillispiralis TaxID=68182 RepID=A0A561TK64_9ACTN|nr:toll/interleukin-1 receptor domain-containing protein [Streptomyces capillispiralis]TWF87424.1 TIR domain-containing protein [Streptomyces capillispiralis]GHH92649.1 hypothetical protein GCM10017779_31060 [Streptomyces capillispiralis]
MAGIFINYRTGDGDKAAELVDRELVDVFGEGRVFRDRRSMPEGTNFPPALLAELLDCTVLLVLIGPNWLTIRDEKTMERRIDTPGDYVRVEITAAIEHHKIIIPVLLDTPFPEEEEIPKPIVGIRDRQAAHLRAGYSHHDLPILVERLKEFVPEVKKKRGEDTGRTEIKIRNKRGATSIYGDATYNEGRSGQINGDL